MPLTTITCVQRDPVDACHEINTLNEQTPLPPPKDNRRLWLHHLNVWPSPVLQRGRPFTVRLQCAAQKCRLRSGMTTETAKFSLGPTANWSLLAAVHESVVAPLRHADGLQ
jgi:hypothetical protein